MKKFYLLLTVFAAFTFVAKAQPTLTSANNPVAGTTVTYEFGDTTAQPGPSGASQNWDFSTNVPTGNTSSYDYMLASSAPNGASFPTANLAQKDNATNDYTYFNAGTDSITIEGVTVAATGTNLVYSNVQTLQHYPLNFQDSLTDNFAATYNAFGFNGYRTGTWKMWADGWGTIMTPNGTTNNVMRLHYWSLIRDSIAIPGSPQIITVETNRYVWYEPGNPQYIFSIDYVTSGGSTTKLVSYPGTPASVDDNSFASSVHVYPNPMEGKGLVTLNLEKASEVNIHLYNALGQEVQQMSKNLSAGQNSVVLNVSSLPAGVYFVQVKAADAVATRRIIVN